MRPLLTTILLIILSSICFSQEIVDITFRQDKNKMIINYKIINIRSDRNYFTSVYVSSNGGKTFKGPLKAVSGDVGEIKKPEGVKTITWNVFDEFQSIQGDIVIDIRLKAERIPLQQKTFVVYSISSLAPFGVMVGSGKRFGWYMAAQTNGSFNNESSYVTDNKKLVDYNGNDYYEYDDIVKRVRYSFHLGGTFRAGKNITTYVGVGYGSRHLLWQVTEYSYTNNSKLGVSFADHIDFSHDGPEAEIGILLMVNRISIGVGYNTLNFKNGELLGSIGLIF